MRGALDAQLTAYKRCVSVCFGVAPQGQPIPLNKSPPLFSFSLSLFFFKGLRGGIWALLKTSIDLFWQAMRRSLSLTSIRGTLNTIFPLRAFSTASGAPSQAPAAAPSQAPAAAPSAPVVEEEVWDGNKEDLNEKGYKNFLQETLYVLHCNGKKPSDVLHVVNEHRMGTWAEFALMSDFEYNSGYGTSTVSVDPQLVILGKDWWLKRGDYDGSSWWEFMTYPSPPTQGVEKLTMKSIWY